MRFINLTFAHMMFAVLSLISFNHECDRKNGTLKTSEFLISYERQAKCKNEKFDQVLNVHSSDIVRQFHCFNSEHLEK